MPTTADIAFTSHTHIGKGALPQVGVLRAFLVATAAQNGYSNSLIAFSDSFRAGNLKVRGIPP